MNKAYRTVWNASLGAFVAASERDKTRGKGNSRTCAPVVDGRDGDRRSTLLHGASLRILPALVLAALGAWGTQAQAQVNCSSSPYNFFNGSDSCAGFLSTASGGGATALGYAANATGINATDRKSVV